MKTVYVKATFLGTATGVATIRVEVCGSNLIKVVSSDPHDELLTSGGVSVLDGNKILSLFTLGTSTFCSVSFALFADASATIPLSHPRISMNAGGVPISNFYPI